MSATLRWRLHALPPCLPAQPYILTRVLETDGLARLQALFRRSQLKAMLDIHGIDYGLGGDLSEDEITVIRGALDLSHKTATSCMTPLEKVTCCCTANLGCESVLSKAWPRL